MVLVSLRQALDLPAPLLQLSTAEEVVLAEKDLVADLEGVLEVKVLEEVTALQAEGVGSEEKVDLAGLLIQATVLQVLDQSGEMLEDLEVDLNMARSSERPEMLMEGVVTDNSVLPSTTRCVTRSPS